MFRILRTELRDGAWLTRDRVRAYAVIVLGAELLALLTVAGRTYQFFLPIDPPTSLDYLSFYAAGTLADRGTPALVYDETRQKAIEQRIYGDPRVPYYGFYYPPVFQLLCAVLAAFPFTLSYLLFMLTSGAAYVVVIYRTVRDSTLVLALLSFPAVFLNILVGQNSFLTTALFGGALLLLERHPILSGLLFGALCYKPHFLVMIPIALLAGRHWLTIFAAAASAAALFGLSVVFLGWQTWQAFLANALLAQSVFESGRVRFWQLMSLFGAVRLMGGEPTLAYLIQAVAIAAAAILTAWVWYQRPSLPARALVLIAATLISVPVILSYDLLLGALAIAWLVPHARAHGYFPWEKTILFAMWPIALFGWAFGEQTHIPTAPLMTVALLTLAFLHARRELASFPNKFDRNLSPASSPP